MPLPIAHGLIGASIVAAALPAAPPARNWRPLLIGAGLAIFPDLDYVLGAASHRAFTHSLLFAAAAGLVCLAVGWRANFRAAAGCAVAALSHVLLDFATTKAMPGVELFWPVSERRFGLGLVDYYSLTGVDPVFFLSKDVLKDLFKMAAFELAVFVPLFIVVLFSKRPAKGPLRP